MIILRYDDVQGKGQVSIKNPSQSEVREVFDALNASSDKPIRYGMMFEKGIELLVIASVIDFPDRVLVYFGGVLSHAKGFRTYILEAPETEIARTDETFVETMGLSRNNDEVCLYETVSKATALPIIMEYLNDRLVESQTKLDE